jgi:hypothetical protein
MNFLHHLTLTRKKRHDDLLIPHDPDVEESQEERDPPKILHVVNVSRKYGELAHFFITV